MSHVTWEGPAYTSVHHETCGHLGKHQDRHWSEDERYVEHPNLEAAIRYAEENARGIRHCRCTA